MSDFKQAEALLRHFKGDNYLYGLNLLTRVGTVAAGMGNKIVLVADQFPGSKKYVEQIRESIKYCGLTLAAQLDGAAPNCPLEDLQRITESFIHYNPDVIVSFGGGSTIDCVKAAEVLNTLGGSVEDYFGTGLVTEALAKTKKTLTPHIAIQSAASSGAHLTKYANITNVSTGQKKLIVDNAIVPQKPVFDYSVTFTAPLSLTCDGALDGISHCLEVLYSAVGKPDYEQIEAIAVEGTRLVVRYLPEVLMDPGNAQARQALGLATDLGGYAIMAGGTNGAHLTSFSLVDILSHGRACGMLNPYYSVFFAPAIPRPLQTVGKVFQDAGYIDEDLTSLDGRHLGLVVAQGMIRFEEKIGFPTRLCEIPGFSSTHIERALAAAKNPQLRMKLVNMPVALTAEMVDEYMGLILQAASTGDLTIIKNVQ